MASRAPRNYGRFIVTTTPRAGVDLRDVQIAVMPLRAPNFLEVSAGCHQMQARTTMIHVAMAYRRPAGALRQSVKPQLASWDRAGHPSQVKLARFLAHVDAIAGPVLATVSGRVAVELIVGFSDGVHVSAAQRPVVILEYHFGVLAAQQVVRGGAPCPANLC